MGRVGVVLSEPACDELTCPLPSSFPFQQRFQDTSQYVCAELQALEQEQGQIDGRAAEVEKQLRSLMESGGTPDFEARSSTASLDLPSSAAVSDLGRGCEETPLESLWWTQEAGWWDVAETSEIPQENKSPPPIPSCSALAGGISGDCPGLIQVPTGCRRRC